MNQHVVFVYGTLRIGQEFHDFMGGRTPRFTAYTLPEFDLVSLGSYPAILPDGQTSVKGEVYEVDDPTLGALDELEEHPQVYTRKLITVTHDGQSSQVWAYLLPRDRFEGGPQIPEGDWVQWFHMQSSRR